MLVLNQLNCFAAQLSTTPVMQAFLVRDSSGSGACLTVLHDLPKYPPFLHSRCRPLHLWFSTTRVTEPGAPQLWKICIPSSIDYDSSSPQLRSQILVGTSSGHFLFIHLHSPPRLVLRILVRNWSTAVLDDLHPLIIQSSPRLASLILVRGRRSPGQFACTHLCTVLHDSRHESWCVSVLDNFH